jgi:bifunctional DNA-binding transcriptional regulator/antitoxin component of YhaV-PrlF toxin-antitoxin module
MITVPIDKQGRLVLPRAIRERLGLPAGQEGRLRLWESADRVMIEAEPRQSRIDTGDDGMPVLHVAGLGEVDNDAVLAAIHRDRDTR